MDNIIEVQFNEMLQRTRSIWQYDYGQVLKILSGGVVLPNFLEVHFSLSRENEKCITRIGTTVNGAIEVQIPNELLNTENKTHDYFIYAFIYVSTEKYGNTKCEIIIPVKSRIKPENPSEEPLPEPNIFHETVEAVNVAADRAKMAEQSAKESATEAGKYAASASESAVTAEKTKEDALRKVGEKKREAIEAIQNQEETSVGKITTHTDGEIQRIQNQATESKGELEQTITNAGVSKEELEHSIETAGTSKTALDKSVELAGTAKTELDTSTQKAGEANTALDGSVKTAGEMQETLSATVKQAGALNTSLGEEIETGTQLKTDLTASGEKAVQDIQTAGSEQLGKMQAVAEEFTADREQIANNKEDIGSLKEGLGNKITKFYASNQGETHITDSDNGKIMDMMLYGRSEQKQYKGVNLFPPDTKLQEYVEVSIPKETKVFAITDGTKFSGGNFLFFNADKTKSEWFGLDKGTTVSTRTLTIDAKYVQNLLEPGLDVSKICLGIGNEPIYEPYVGGQPSPSPDYPQEIKSVVNPIVKVYGKNMMPYPKDNTVREKGVTLTVKDGKYTLVGKLTENTWLNIYPQVLDSTTTNMLSEKPLPTKGKKLSMINGGMGYSLNFRKVSNKDKVFGIEYGSTALADEDSNGVFLYIFNIDKTYNDTFEIMISDPADTTSTVFEPYTEQEVSLPYTLNAIPVSSGGNVTINGQQYIADYVDVERGKVVRMCKYKKLLSADVKKIATSGKMMYVETDEIWDAEGNYTSRKFDMLYSAGRARLITAADSGWGGKGKIVIENVQFTHIDEAKNYFDNNDVYACYPIPTPEEIPITLKEVSTFKQLLTYYPVTNISVTSDQLDGYTVFNYPISMANGWNYVKQQLNDNRDYIYDMDAQSAEAYVNSEYAVVLTELEV